MTKHTVFFSFYSPLTIPLSLSPKVAFSLSNMNATVNNDKQDVVFTGVPSTYDDLYQMMCFFLLLFGMGDVLCQRILRIVPSLVGYIVTGVLLGPEGWNWIPIPEAWVLLGNIGLVLFMTQAGLEMDLGILKKIGPRGCIMAIVGSILPISLAMFLSKYALGQSGKTVIAMGCCFGPTSAGIAIHVLGQCSVLETPLGQLIVAAAIVDDMIALVVLSQLEALTGDASSLSVAQIVVPIVSALLWLFVGGALALFVLPVVHQWVWDRIAHSSIRKQLTRRMITGSFGGDHNDNDDDNDNHQHTFSFLLLLGLLYGLLPATFYSQASYLMGAFLAGLSFCQEERKESVSVLFRTQFKRLIGWLMKLFFAATIGFQVPLSEFGNWQVIRNGCILYLSLFGKLAVGPLLTPQFDDNDASSNGNQRWNNPQHVRDCAVVGLSMAGEAEFAFLVAVFGVTEQLIPPDLYASVVLAILMSTILSPLLLRTLLSIYPIVPKEEAQVVDEEEEDTSHCNGDNPHHDAQLTSIRSNSLLPSLELRNN